MKPFMNTFVTIVLLIGKTVYASYCEKSDGCCAYSNLGRKTCPGAGTSDITDLFSYFYQGDSQVLIAGATNGLFFVWIMRYVWAQGASAILTLDTTYAYVLEVPKSNYTEHTLYFIQISGCPSISILTRYTRGNLPSTTIPYSVIYKSVRLFAKNSPCPGPCNVVQGGFQAKETDFFNNLNRGIAAYLSNLVSFEYDCFDEYGDCRNPRKIAKKLGLRVKQGICPSTYLLADYPSGVTQTCKPKSNSTPEGLALVEQGFNFTVLLEPGGACALSVALGTLYASSTSDPYLTVYERAVLFREPYKEIFIMDFLAQHELAYPRYQGILSLC